MNKENPRSRSVWIPDGRKKPDSLELYPFDTRKPEHIIITRIRITDVASVAVPRMKICLYVAVEIDGNPMKTSRQPVIGGQDVVEWNEEIFVPSECSSIALFKVYAYFGRSPRTGSGQLLGQLVISVGDMLHYSGQPLPVKTVSKKERKKLPSFSSLRVIAERRTCNFGKLTRLDLPRPDASSDPRQVAEKGRNALLRYNQFHDQTDLDEAIANLECSRNTSSPDDRNHSALLFNLATVKFIQCQDSKNYLDLDVPIALYQDALQLRTGNHPCRITALDLCFAILANLRKRGDEVYQPEIESYLIQSYAYGAAWFALQMAGLSVSVPKVDRGISQTDGINLANRLIRRTRPMLRDAVDWDPRLPGWLACLGLSLYHRFDDNGALVDLHEAILMLQKSTQHIPDGHPDKPDWLGFLGMSLSSRFQRLGDLADVNRSILAFDGALRLLSDDHSSKPSWLNDLGNLLLTRFERLGHLSDVDRSISRFKEAIRLTPNGQNRPVALNNLANSLSRRFEYSNDPEDINKSMAIRDEALRLTPDGHSDKPSWLNNLGISLSCRFRHFGDPVDINKSVSVLQTAAGLVPDGHPSKPHLLNNLASLLFLRFSSLGDLADMSQAISIFEKAARLVPDGHPDKPLLLAHLGNSLLGRFQRFGELADVDRSILFNQDAIHLIPDDHIHKANLLMNLGSSFYCRFERGGDLADINKSILMTEKAIRLTSLKQ